MENRYRVEIYDEVKQNDVTLFFEQGVTKEFLTELVYSNLLNFNGNIKGYVFDQLKKKKTTAIFLPMEMVQGIKSKLTNTARELGLV